MHSEGAATGVLVRREPAGQRQILLVEVNRPEKRNALNTAALRAIKSAYHQAESSSEIAAVVLSSRGSVFSAGGDLREFGPSDSELARRRAELMVEVFSYPRRLATPVITAAQGAAMGAGAALSLSADIVIASSDFSLGLPEVAKGISPALVMPPVAEHLGQRVALDMVLTGRTVEAQEALRLGGISRVASGSAVEEAVRLAERIAKYDPLLVGRVKALFAGQAGRDLEPAYRLGLAG